MQTEISRGLVGLAIVSCWVSFVSEFISTVSFSVLEPPAKGRLWFSVQCLFCLTSLGSTVLSVHPLAFWRISILNQVVVQREKISRYKKDFFFFFFPQNRVFFYAIFCWSLRFQRFIQALVLPYDLNPILDLCPVTFPQASCVTLHQTFHFFVPQPHLSSPTPARCSGDGFVSPCGVTWSWVTEKLLCSCFRC